MRNVSIEFTEILRAAAVKLEKSDDYQWGHMGSCNCGFLAREITHLRKDEIHHKAMQGTGDWNEQLNSYCPNSGIAMDDLIKEMLDTGLDIDDLKNLERLSDPHVLEQLPVEERNLRHNIKDDVAKYMRTWASLLEDQFTQKAEYPYRTGVTSAA